MTATEEKPRIGPVVFAADDPTVERLPELAIPTVAEVEAEPELRPARRPGLMWIVVASAVALKNLEIMQDEKIVEHVRDVAHPYLMERWQKLADHPLVGEAKLVGLMGSIALTPDKAARARFASDAGTVGYRCRERCFANNLIMRHVGDRMIIAPSLTITPAEIDVLIDRATTSLDECYAGLKSDGLLKAA